MKLFQRPNFAYAPRVMGHFSTMDLILTKVAHSASEKQIKYSHSFNFRVIKQTQFVSCQVVDVNK